MGDTPGAGGAPLEADARRGGSLGIGLMSGTSGDGITAALVRLDGRAVPPASVVAWETFPYPPDLAARARGLMNATAAELCAMNFLLGERLAEAAWGVLRKARIPAARVSFIGSHGHTARHVPRGEGAAATLQIGEPAVIAARTGIRVVSGFRAADVAAGGQGAPLVPLAEGLLFGHPRKIRALLNLGGIANLTVLLPGGAVAAAFDTGPGNALLDEAARRATGGAAPFDDGGRLALRGRVHEPLLSRLVRHPYFARRPPKSTGRETFGPELFSGIVRDFPRLRPEDLCATLAYFTAWAVQEGLRRFVRPRWRVEEVFVSGGGTKNAALMGRLRELLLPARTALLDELGFPGEAKEAAAFAILADRTLRGLPGNVPRATGARAEVVLGNITPAPAGRGRGPRRFRPPAGPVPGNCDRRPGPLDRDFP